MKLNMHSSVKTTILSEEMTQVAYELLGEIVQQINQSTSDNEVAGSMVGLGEVITLLTTAEANLKARHILRRNP